MSLQRVTRPTILGSTVNYL